MVQRKDSHVSPIAARLAQEGTKVVGLELLQLKKTSIDLRVACHQRVDYLRNTEHSFIRMVRFQDAGSLS